MYANRRIATPFAELQELHAINPWQRQIIDSNGHFVDRAPRRQHDPASASHPNWIPPSLVPVHLVCGPPAGGKSTFVREHAGPDNLVIDLDAIANELTGEPRSRGWDRDLWLRPALAVRNARLAALAKPGPWPQAWFIIGEPKAQARAWWRTTLGTGITYLLLTPPAVCLARVEDDPERRAVATLQRRIIADWWRKYRPAPGDTVVRHA